MFWRSKDILQSPEWALGRGLYKSMGYSDYDLSRPLIGVANSWNRVVPGHYNLQLVSDYVKQGIFQAGGTPVEFGVDRRLRRDRPGARRDALHPADPRPHRQRRRDDDRGPPPGRRGSSRLLRQDRPRHADGCGPHGHPGHPGGRGAHGRRLRVRRPGRGHLRPDRRAGHAENGKDDRRRIPPSGKLRRARLRLLLVLRNGQHHVLPGRSPRPEPSGERHDPGHPRRPPAGRPGIGAARSCAWSWRGSPPGRSSTGRASKTPSASTPRSADPPMPSCTCWPSPMKRMWT